MIFLKFRSRWTKWTANASPAAPLGYPIYPQLHACARISEFDFRLPDFRTAACGCFIATEAMFQTGWFMESLATQVLVIFVIRTRRKPVAQPAKSSPRRNLARGCGRWDPAAVYGARAVVRLCSVAAGVSGGSGGDGYLLFAAGRSREALVLSPLSAGWRLALASPAFSATLERDVKWLTI